MNPETTVRALSIKLPEDLAAASLDVARRLGVSRSELIRQALVHEIEQAGAVVERRAMADSLQAMGRDPVARRAAEDLDGALDEPLPPEQEGWWRG